MPVEPWNEVGKTWDDDTGWLDEAQIARCARAEDAETFRSPVPTRMVSNGEYMPIPQTKGQQQVEARIQDLSETASKKLGMSRRRFLASTGGMAAAFLAMNDVFGPLFAVSPDELYEPAAYAEHSIPTDVFVFDDQLHFVRSSMRGGLAGLRAAAQGPTTPGFSSNPYNPQGELDEHGDPWGVWNPGLYGMPIEPETFQLVQFIKDVFLDSQVHVGLISNVTAFNVRTMEGTRPAKSVEEARPFEILTAAQTVAGRNFINELAGSTRCLAHGLLYPGKGNLEYIQYQIDEHQPDSWKGYNISNAAKVDDDPESPMKQWRHDDEEVAYPTFELILKNYQRLKDQKPGLNNICVHKGLAPGPSDAAEHGHPSDLPRAAQDWPDLNFITYHACIKPAMFYLQSLRDIQARKLREGVPDIAWSTEYALLAAPYSNIYAEIGTTWASTVITFPTVTAHLMGQLMKFMGEDRICFGSDSVWYGAPQWQIEALWRFQIPEAMREEFGYPELTPQAKRKILGLTSARLYGMTPSSEIAPDATYRPMPADYAERIPEALKTVLEFPEITGDNMSEIKERYLAMGPAPSNTRYGWIRTSV